MSNSTTLLDTLSASDSQKEVTNNELFDAASPATAFGRHGSACTGLTWGYYGGTVDISGVPTQIANGTLALTGSTTNYIKVSTAGSVTTTTSIPSGWPGPLTNAKALYSVVTGVSSVTSYTDYRTSLVALSSNSAFVGDNGGSPNSGVAGLVPAPNQGDSTKFLKGDGTWATASTTASTVLITPAYAASMSVDLHPYTAYDFVIVDVTLTGNVTFDLNNGRDGQIIRVRLTQGGAGSYTFSAGAHLRASTDVPFPTLTTTVGKMDRLGFEWFSGSPGNADLLAVTKGF